MASPKRRGAARFTWFFVEAYEESDGEREKLRLLRMTYREHACACHDSDTYNEEQVMHLAESISPADFAALPRDAFGHYLKKRHWHFVFRTNQRTVKNFANELGLDERFVQGITSPEAALRYLVHADDPDKFQYPPEVIEGPLVERALEAIRRDVCPDEDQCVLDLLAIVFDQQPGNLAELAAMAARAGLFSHYRKNYAMVRDCYREMCEERKFHGEASSVWLAEAAQHRADHDRAVASVRARALRDPEFCEQAAVIATEQLFKERSRALSMMNKEK